MIDVNEVYEMIEFYADRLDFNNLLCENYFQYSHMISDLKSHGINLIEKRVCRLKNDLQLKKTTLSKVEYVINQLADGPIKNDLKSMLEKEKNKKLLVRKKVGPYLYALVHE